MFHQLRKEWLEAKMEENEEMIARYLAEVGETRSQVGNFAIALEGERPVVIYRPEGEPYEQLEIDEEVA
jgi:hypothetical protein